MIDNLTVSTTEISQEPDDPEMSGTFSDSSDGLYFEFNDGGYTDDYDVYIASYNGDKTLASVEMFNKADGADGVYAVSDNFEYEDKRCV